MRLSHVIWFVLLFILAVLSGHNPAMLLTYIAIGAVIGLVFVAVVASKKE